MEALNAAALTCRCDGKGLACWKCGTGWSGLPNVGVDGADAAGIRGGADCTGEALGGAAAAGAGDEVALEVGLLDDPARLGLLETMCSTCTGGCSMPA